MVQVGPVDSSVFELVGTSVYTVMGGVGIVFFVAIFTGLTALFVLHAVTFWLSTDPVAAFETARMFVGWYSAAWNSVRELYNGALFVLAQFVPAYNLAAKHVVEPTIFITLDVLSLVFARRHYGGVITEDQLPFLGHYCGETGDDAVDARTRRWCTIKSTSDWAAQLNVAPSTDGDNTIGNSTHLVLSTAQVRRLATLSASDDAEGQSIFPTLHLAPLADALSELSGALTMITSLTADLVFHVIYTVLSEMAVLLWNIAQMVLRGLASAALALIRSGALQSILRVGIDLLGTLLIHVALPLLLAVLDVFLCIINFIQPGTWPVQLRCGTLTLLLFTHHTFQKSWKHSGSIHHFVSSVVWQLNACASRRMARSVRRFSRPLAASPSSRAP